MNDELPTAEAEAEETPRVAAGDVERVRTGVERVDEVILAVEELEERPIEEHVGVFETAHQQLRRALDAEEQSDPQQSAP